MALTKNTWILLGFLLLKFVLQYLLIGPEYELHRDEYLYIDQGNHLAWGYASVPPFTAWISAIVQLLGKGVFWVRFFPALFGALTLLVVWKAIEALKGDLFAQILGAVCVLFSALLRLNILYQPNSLDILCWVALFYFLIKYFRDEKPQWLYWAAIVFAVGFLNKYNIGFALIGLLPALLLTAQRRIFADKTLYRAMGLGLLLILPNLIWQYQENFPVVRHMRELVETQLVNVDRTGFLLDQLLFFTGSILLFLLGWAALLFHAPFKKFRFFFWALLFTLAAFVYLRAKSYYAIGLYPIYIAFGAVYLSTLLNSGWKRYLRPLVVALPILVFWPISLIAFPNRSPAYIVAHPRLYQKYGLLRWEDGQDHALPQDFADMRGWRELAAKVDAAYAALPNADRTLVLCDNYGQAGAINYYGKKGIRAVSFNADYLNWFDLETRYVNLIRVKYKEEREEEFAKTSPYFEASTIYDSITDPYARERGTTIFVFEGAKANVNVNQRIAEEIEAERNPR
jgi:4-amino-4-deoxy-L-arabinose transferase-like glycosyltransferase